MKQIDEHGNEYIKESEIGFRLNNVNATVNPTATDDINLGYQAGSVWLNIALKIAFIMIDNTATAAVWERLAIVQHSPTDAGVVYYNSTTKQFETSAGFLYAVATKTLSVGRTQYDISLDNPTHSEGLTFYDKVNKCLAYYNDEVNATMQVGQKIWVRVYNNTGSTINNGQVCYLDSTHLGFPTIGLATASDPAKCLSTLGFATHDIATGSFGYITRVGTVHDVNTTGCTTGSILYLSETVDGGFSNTKPPMPNYNVKLGNCGVIDIITGTIEVQVSVGTNLDDLSLFHNGTFRENFNALVTSDDVTVTMTLEKSGGGDLNAIFSSGIVTVDCTPAKTIVLTHGTDAIKQANYIYILESAPQTLVKSLTEFPASGEHIRVGFFYVGSPVSVNADNGSFINQNWNDAFCGSDNQGHLSHMGRWVREQPPKYKKGIDEAGDGGTYIKSIGDARYFVCSSGLVSQMHLHTWSAKDMSTGADDMHVINEYDIAVPNGVFADYTDLALITHTSNGTLITNNKYYNLAIGGVANKTGQHSPLLAILPSGVYNSLIDAEQDVLGYNNTSLPPEFISESGTGFLITLLTLKKTATSFTLISSVDLRRGTDSISGGSGGGSAIVNFNDSLFTIYNNIDSTKILNFDVSQVGTGTTKTITMPNSNILLQNLAGANTQLQYNDNGVQGATADLAWVNATKELLINGEVGIGTALPLGKLHVKSGSAGTYTPVTSRDELILEGSGDTGMSIISPNANISSIVLGTSSDSVGALINWDYTSSEYTIGTASATAQLIFKSANVVEAMRIDSSQRVGIGATTPLSKLHVKSGSAGTYTPDAGKDELILESSGHGGMSIVTPDASIGSIVFGTPTDVLGAVVNWQYSTKEMTVGSASTGGTLILRSDNYVEAMRIDSAGKVGIGTTTPNASAILDIQSTDKAIIIPRLTTLKRLDLTPTNAMMVYDTDLEQLYAYENSAWTPIISSVSTHTDSFPFYNLNNVNNGYAVDSVSGGSFSQASFYIPEGATNIKIEAHHYVNDNEPSAEITYYGTWGSKTESVLTNTDSLALTGQVWLPYTHITDDITDAFTGVTGGDKCGVQLDYVTNAGNSYAMFITVTYDK